jgi:formylmethanofuran dehydrogenase subunit E
MSYYNLSSDLKISLIEIIEFMTSSKEIYAGAECPKCKHRWIETRKYHPDEEIVCPKCSWGKKLDFNEQEKVKNQKL